MALLLTYLKGGLGSEAVKVPFRTFNTARASDGTSVLRNLFLETTGKANSRWGSRQLHKTVNSASKAGAPAPAAVPMNQLMDDFVNGSTANYIEDLERRYVEDPESVPGSWADFFRRLESGESPDSLSQAYSQYASTSIAATSASSALALQKSIGVTLLIRAYQTQGHLLAKLDPLELDVRPMQQDLDPAAYGFTEQDWDLEMSVDNPEFAGLFDPKDGKSTYTLREIVNRLRNVYCQSIGYEYNYISDKERCDWLRHHIESQPYEFSVAEKTVVFDRLAWSVMFENFLSNKYTASKRFGLEGGETLIPGMKTLIDGLAEGGCETVVIGMPHRGRLNVLANVVRKPLAQIFSEFSGGLKPITEEGDKTDLYSGSGDVKYHLGTSYDRPTLSGKTIHLSLLANPSHLEAVAPVVNGKVRAKQYYLNDSDRSKVCGIILHGDGSHSGQGVVYETYDMSALPEYTTGGSIHIVVNNQVAFTTDPKFSRSSPYCTDVAKALDAPIFHVNGDDVEAVCKVMKIAAEWRQKWKTDVVVDIVCYRKHGHNEIDEPMFTQPLMYNAIKKHPNPLEVYKQRLLSEKSMTGEETEGIQKKINNIMNSEFENAKSYQPKARDWLSSHWEGFKGPDQAARMRNTGVPMEILKRIGKNVTTLPDEFNPHRQVKKNYENRKKAIETGEGIDWATGEMLAYGTLVHEGNHVRLSGQDVERGTFTHRHAVLHDQKTGTRYIPLDHVRMGQHPKQFTVSNSALSEFGVLGFELGYSMQDPNSLVIWEAQFGDFANGAQPMFDQFLSSGEAKWLRQSGLVVQLPHGYDGQGPEHSSARLERFLQMSDDDPYVIPEGLENPDVDLFFRGKHVIAQHQNHNWAVVNVTTPANFFHCLRRQVHRQFRKPLIVMSPKNLLRHPQCKSPLTDFDDELSDDNDLQGIRFRRLIMDESVVSRHPHPPTEDAVKRLVLCSGKIYYEIAQEREKRGLKDDIHICRLEQISPFPYDLVLRELRRYPNAEVMWCQEEPMNMGSYSYVEPRLYTCMKTLGLPLNWPLPYAGRATSAATATGFAEIHASEQNGLINKALTLD